MEGSKDILLKLVFVVPSLLAFGTAIYSIIWWDDLISKILTCHLACVSTLPALIEFSPLFRNYVLPESNKLDSNYFKIGILFYICLATSIFGVGVLASISAIITLLAAVALLIYQYKHQVYEKLGMGHEIPTLEQV